LRARIGRRPCSVPGHAVRNDEAVCHQTNEGLLITRAALASDKVVDMIARNNADLRIFLAALRRDSYISGSNLAVAQSLDEIVTRNPRQATRLTIEYFLRGVKANAEYFEGDFLFALVLLGILSANNRRIIRSPEIAAAYPAITDVPAASHRAPISVTALARSLGLSYETARRKVHRLIDKGMCARTDDGLVLTDQALSGERFMELIRVGNANLRKLITALQRDGLIE
jgi:biotin operon repressor